MKKKFLPNFSFFMLTLLQFSRPILIDQLGGKLLRDVATPFIAKDEIMLQEIINQLSYRGGIFKSEGFN